MQVPTDRLMKVMTIMERNMRDVISADGAHLRVPPLFDDVSAEEYRRRELDKSNCRTMTTTRLCANWSRIDLADQLQRPALQ